jgi:hypothetical protein
VEVMGSGSRCGGGRSGSMSCNSVFSFSPTNWVPIEEEEEEVSGDAERRREDERQNLMMKLMRKCKGEDRLSLPTFRETRGKEGECIKSRQP